MFTTRRRRFSVIHTLRRAYQSVCITLGMHSAKQKIYESDGFVYTLGANSEATIIKTPNADKVIIPEVLDGHPVSGMERFAFSGCSTKEILIHDGVSYIASLAFKNSRSIVAFSVSPHNPFYEQKDGVLFDKMTKTIIAYPSGNPAISYHIPDGIVSIGPTAFADCAYLGCVLVPDSVISIGESAFENCQCLHTLARTRIMTGIGENAFVFERYRHGLSIPEGVTNIGKFAFNHCTSITVISIPGSVISIGTGAFSFCRLLSSIKISTENVRYDLKGPALFDKRMRKLLAFPADSMIRVYKIPVGTAYIGREAFAGCSYLKEIVIPFGVASIEGCAFAGCTHLETVTIPDSVTMVGACAFDGCSNLTILCSRGSAAQVYAREHRIASRDPNVKS